MGEVSDKQGDKRNARRDRVGKTEEKRRLERLSLRWEVGWGNLDWINLADVKNKRWALLYTLMKSGFHNMRGNS